MTQKRFYVRWDIDIFADTPEEAARKALRIQRDPESTATYFHVAETDDVGHLINALTAVDLEYEEA